MTTTFASPQPPRRSRTAGKRLILFSLGAVALILLFLLAFAARASRIESAHRALASTGYQHIDVGAWYPWCEKGRVGSRFTAQEPGGLAVEGFICNGGRDSAIVLKYPLYHRLGHVTEN